MILRLSRRQRCWLALTASSLVHSACGNGWSPERELRALRISRPFIPRLSIPMVYRECGWRDTNDTRVVRSCESPGSELPTDALALAGRAAASLQRQVNPAALRLGALLDLIWSGPNEKMIDRSVSLLEMSHRLDSASASTLVDLGAAYLVRFSRRGLISDLLLSVEASSQALEVQSRDAGATFNRAIALELLGLRSVTAQGWKEYLGIDSSSGWAKEARASYARLSRMVARQYTAPAESLDAARVLAFGDTEARRIVWENVLGAWGRAYVRNDSASASRLLRVAATIGDSLAAHGGDSAVSDAVGAIVATRTSRAQSEVLAQAHMRYARAQLNYRLASYEAADTDFVAILASAPVSPILRSWTELFHGMALVYRLRPTEGQLAISAVARSANPSRHPALFARAHWAHGNMLLRGGLHDAGLQSIRAAQRVYAALGEQENLGAVEAIEAEVLLSLGDEATGLDVMRRALRRLRTYDASVWRHNALILLARVARARGLASAAALIEDEDEGVAAALNRPVYVLESQLWRARADFMAGATASGTRRMQGTVAAVQALPEGATRRYFEAELALTRAVGMIHADPSTAALILDSALAAYRQTGNASKTLATLVARADARLALDQLDAAEQDLDSIALIYSRRGADITRLPQRAALMSRARRAFNRLASLRLREGRVDDALRIIEASRVSVLPRSVDARAQGSRLSQRQASALDFAMIDDTVFIWSLARGKAFVTSRVVVRDSLRAAIGRVRAALELGAGAHVIREDLADLYDWLLRPVQAHIDAAGPVLTIVADEMLGDVPFASLYDRERQQYLVERVAVRFRTLLAESERRAPSGPSGDRVTFVAGTTMENEQLGGLQPLPAVTEEVTSSASYYGPGARVLVNDVDSAALVQSLSHSNVFHFAGHAVFDDQQPERSLLAVSPRGLRAETIATLDLRHLRLVVLSSCQTMSAVENRSGGFAGVAESFLAAGVGGIVGSPWRVGDAETAQLMRLFHENYSVSRNAADALRVAQLRMLRMDGTQSRSMSMGWAAFRYWGE